MRRSSFCSGLLEAGGVVALLGDAGGSTRGGSSTGGGVEGVEARAERLEAREVRGGGAAEAAEERGVARGVRVARGDLDDARREDHRERVRVLDRALRPRLLRVLPARAQHAHEPLQRPHAPQQLHPRPHHRLHKLLHTFTHQFSHFCLFSFLQIVIQNNRHQQRNNNNRTTKAKNKIPTVQHNHNHNHNHNHHIITSRSKKEKTKKKQKNETTTQQLFLTGGSKEAAEAVSVVEDGPSEGEARRKTDLSW